MSRGTDISRWRRVAMQAIMWIVLAATVGLAALADSRINRTRNALGSPVTLGGDVQVRLPKGWVGADDDESMVEVAESANDELTRRLSVKLGPPSSLIESLRALADVEPGGGSTKNSKIQIAGADGTLLTRRVSVQPGFYYVEVNASAILPPGKRKLTISLREFNTGKRSEIDSDIDLVKRVAASVKIGEERN